MPSTQTSADLLARIQQMDADGFEQFIADLWERRGWTTTVSQTRIGGGSDVTATKKAPDPKTHVIRAKCYESDIIDDNTEIQQSVNLVSQEKGVDMVVIVTPHQSTSRVTDNAQAPNVKLVNGDGLVALIERLDAHDLVDDYAAITTNAEAVTTGPPATVEADNSKIPLPEISPDTYLGFIILGTTIWSIGFFVGLAGYSSGIVGSVVAIAAVNCWIMLPLSLYHEASRVDETTDWSPSRTLYAIGGAIPFLNAVVGGAYLYRRRHAYQQRQTADSVSERIA